MLAPPVRVPTTKAKRAVVAERPVMAVPPEMTTVSEATASMSALGAVVVCATARVVASVETATEVRMFVARAKVALAVSATAMVRTVVVGS